MKTITTRKRFKRALVLLLTLVLLVGMSPIIALAEHEPGLLEEELFVSADPSDLEDLTEPEEPDDFAKSGDPDDPDDLAEPGDPGEPDDLAEPGDPDSSDDLLAAILTLAVTEADMGGNNDDGGELPDYGDSEFAPDEIIIVFEDVVVEVFSEALISEEQMTETLSEVLDELPGEMDDVALLDEGAVIFATVELPDEVTVEEAIAEYQRNPLIKYAQPNFIYHLQTDLTPLEIGSNEFYDDIVSTAPDGIFYPQSTAWRPDDPIIGTQMTLTSASHLDRVGAFEAWEMLQPLIRSKIRVAVIDTQIQLDHPDLDGRLLTDLAVNIQTYNVTNESAWSVLDPHDRHGTHVAGLIGATSNNGEGSAGVAAGHTNNIVDIIPINVFEWNSATRKYDSAYTNIVSRAIDYAVRPSVNARVINMSLGGPGSFDNLFNNTINRAHNAGAVVVAAAGNTGRNEIIYPADFPNVIGVINVAHTTNAWEAPSWLWPPSGKGWVPWELDVNPRSYSSSHGPGKNISAPGAMVWSTVPTDMPDTSYYIKSDRPDYQHGYDLLNGTSMAAPVVSGVAAMVLFADPDLSSSQVADILCKTATDVHTPGRDDDTGHGVVNAAAAVQFALSEEPSNKIDITADFKCPDFLEEIRLIVGKQTAPILKRDVATIKVLNLSGCFISSLDGIEHFTALEELDISFNFLKALDVSELHFLNTLKCNNNNLTAIKLSNTAPYGYIDVRENELPSKSAITGKVTNPIAWDTGYFLFSPQKQLPTFGISLSKSGTQTFTAAAFGYSAQTAVSVTVNNTGNSPTGALTVALSGTDAGSFTLSRASIPSLADKGSTTFTIVPGTGLAAGIYSAIVRVSGGSSITAQTFNVSFTVNRAAGAAVSMPTIASFTHNSVTVNAATISTQTGQAAEAGLTVEYAISTDSALPVNGWQTDRTFDNLIPGTTYRVFARMKADANHNAGAAGSVIITTRSKISANPPPATLPFNDVPQGVWYRDYVGWAYANDITTGTSPTTFAPNSNVTRGQFATFLYRMAGEPAVSGSHGFRDVPAGMFYSTPVLWAAQTKVTTGTNSTTFDPNEYITREQLITMLHRYIRDLGLDSTAPAGALNRFPDGGNVSSWATDAMRWGAHNGIIGAGGTLNPRGNATRAETVAMLQRVVDTFNL